MKLYLVRHGQTAWNIEHRAQGHTDIPLDETGITQAKALREKIKNLDYDVVYSSPLKRATETAEIITNDEDKIIFDERLVERSFGNFEGKVVESWSNLVEGVDIGDLSLDQISGGVETAKSILARAKDFLDDLRTKYPNDTKILIVSHGGIGKAIHFNIVDYDAPIDWSSFHLENCEVAEYEI